MKNVLLLIIGLILLAPEINKAQQIVSVTLESVSLEYNNSVGNEWSTSGTVNGRYIFRGDSVHVRVDPDASITIEASATESDKYSDYGSSRKRIKVAHLNKTGPTNIPVLVTVREDRGRYAGISGSLCPKSLCPTREISQNKKDLL